MQISVNLKNIQLILFIGIRSELQQFHEGADWTVGIQSLLYEQHKVSGGAPCKGLK